MFILLLIVGFLFGIFSVGLVIDGGFSVLSSPIWWACVVTTIVSWGFAGIIEAIEEKK